MTATGFHVEKLLAPKSIALVGVSGDAGRATYTGTTAVLSNLIKFGYPGEVFPINPKYDSIMGLASYASIEALPKTPDLLVVGVASAQVLPILEDAAKKGIGACIVISSGFGESENDEGKLLQERMVCLSQESGMRILGPNCLGIVNVYGNTTAISMNALSAGPVLPGQVAIISQSGALESTWLIRARDKGFGYSYVISSGNNADLELADFIYYLMEDPHTKVIAAYVEGIRDLEKFQDAACLCWKKGIPLVIYKSGRSPKGAQAAQAHTGSVPASNSILDALFEKCHVLSVNSLDQFLDIPQALSQTKKNVNGLGIGVLSISGGAASVVADVVEYLLPGEKIPDFAPDTVAALKELLPDFATVQNPLDTTAAIMRVPADLVKVARVIEADPNIDAIVVPLTVTDHAFETTVAEEFCKFHQTCRKPLIISWFSGSLNQEGMIKMRQCGVPCFDSPEGSLQYYKILKQLARWERVNP